MLKIEQDGGRKTAGDDRPTQTEFKYWPPFSVLQIVPSVVKEETYHPRKIVKIRVNTSTAYV